MSRSKTQGDGTLTAIIAAFVAPVLTLGLAWLVGNSLTTRWDTVKKQAELDLAAMEQFYKIYGEFFAVWKLWEDAIQRNGGKRNERLSVPFWEVREPFREVRPIAPAGR
jgi:hypothetical protein